MKKQKSKFLVPQCLSNLGLFKKAFTLAEVLITLGIIGVVAAMTIPTLMVDINTRQWSTAADVFEKKLNESLKTMNTQQTIAGHTTTLSFVEELAKHFKINKICKNNELQNCFPETVYWGAGEATPEEVDMTTIKQASHFGLDDWGTELIGVQFANGVAGLVAYNPACSGDPYSNQFKGTGCISMLYDTSGDKNPNTSGKDIGNYGVINRLGNATCAFEINGTCFTAPFVPEPYIWKGCTGESYVETPTTTSNAEDLAFMRQYGIQYCMSPDYGTVDYWAGAVKACGGVDKMVTNSHLLEIVEYIYGTKNLIREEDTIYDTIIYPWDSTKVTELGFNTSGFAIFSNEQYHYTGVETDTIYFSNVGAYPWWPTRTADFVFAICINP